MLYAPEVGHALQELGAAIRFRANLSPRVREMAILVVAQAWDSGYERASHEPIGREAGLTEPEIEALRVGADPGFADEQERIAYQVVRALAGPADLDDEQYSAAVARSASRPWSSCRRWSATTPRWPCNCVSSASPADSRRAARQPGGRAGPAN